MIILMLVCEGADSGWVCARAQLGAEVEQARREARPQSFLQQRGERREQERAARAEPGGTRTRTRVAPEPEAEAEAEPEPEPEP